MKPVNTAFPYGALFCAGLFIFTPLQAGKDTYSQVSYECALSEIKNSKHPENRKLTIYVSNRSKYIGVYGFKVDATSLDCKLPKIDFTEEFISRACTVSGKATISLGSMATPPRDDIAVPPGQTRSFQYKFKYPDYTPYKKHHIEYCSTHSTATFTASEAPEILGLTRKTEKQTPSFWERLKQQVRDWF